MNGVTLFAIKALGTLPETSTIAKLKKIYKHESTKFKGLHRKLLKQEDIDVFLPIFCYSTG